MKEKILRRLEKGSFISGQQIADELKISRTAVFKHIDALKKIGFKIEAVPRQGYRLVKQTTKIHPLVVNKCLKTKFVGRTLLHFDQVNSTINQVMLRADKAKEGLVVVAEKQVKGRGRFKRQWASPKGGIWTSILLKPICPPVEAACINIVASLAIAEAIEEIFDLEALIKWPNDIVVKGRKVAGILTEMKAELDKIDYAVVSFGLNANNSVPVELRKIAISLKEATGTTVDRLTFFCLVLQKLENHYLHWQGSGFSDVLRAWKKRCFTIGKTVEVRGLSVGAQRAVPLQGKVLDVNDNGQLVLKTADGKKHFLSAGDVTISVSRGRF